MSNIIIVEDDLFLANSELKFLGQSGFKCALAKDGRVAMRMISANHASWDLCILDVGLPEISGIEVCKRIRRMGKEMPIIMLTGSAEQSVIINALNIGADMYLHKPISPSHLLAQITALIRRPAHFTNKILQLGEVTVDLTSREVFLHGAKVVLRRKEYEVLVFLARHVGQTFSRDQIIEQLWDTASQITSNGIDVVVSKLRKKFGWTLSGNKTNAYIATIYRYGYCLKVQK